LNKNDPNDARSVAVAALRSRQVSDASLDDHTVVLRVWGRCYRDLGRLRTQVMCRLHTVLCEMVPGGFSREISAGQAIQVLAGIVADSPMTAARLELAHDLVGGLQRIDEQRREVRRRAARAVTSSATSITEIYGVGPIVAASARLRPRHPPLPHSRPLRGL
jgi:transposase